jgi:endonuclease/exonuclease/phosphatase family metal-dependent hydrolase
VRVLPDGTAVFAFDRPWAGSVEVAGDFTGWAERPIRLRPDPRTDLWVGKTPEPLPDGPHFYKFVVDGVWQPDPANPVRETDGYGGVNSAFGVGGRDLGGEGAVRIVSLNLRMHQEPEPLLKLEQVAVGLAAMDVDVAALQAVAEHETDPSRPHAGEHLRRRLSRLTGRQWYLEWAPAEGAPPGYRQGVALLSQMPAELVRTHLLPGDGPVRKAIGGTFNVGGTELRIVSAHVSWIPEQRSQQVKGLLDALEAERAGPWAATVLAGDFNAEPSEADVVSVGSAGFADLGAAGGPDPDADGAGPTFDDPPTHRIDYQFLRPTPGRRPPASVRLLRIFNRNVDAGCYQPRVSDHVGLLGVYRFV